MCQRAVNVCAVLRSRALALTAALAVASVALAGCSSSEKGSGTGPTSAGSSSASSSAAAKPADAEKFVTDALDAFQNAPSAHVSGQSSSGNEQVALDIKYGKDVAIGTITLSGNKIELSKVADGTTYFKGDAAFWTSAGVPAASVATLDGKYVKVTASTQGFSDFAKLLDRTQFVDQFRPSSSDLTGAEVTGPSEVNGVSCYAVVDSDQKGAFYAAADGTPYPVQLKSQGSGEFDFDGFNDTVTVPTPDPADVVTLPGS